MKQRAYRFDNMKAILIFAVVFGHLLEVFAGKISGQLYAAIYSVHMPAFLFVTGYFASFHPKKIMRHLVFPYLVFQILYVLFQACVIENGAAISLQFSTPYWLLWYLFSTGIYFMLIPMLQTKNKHKAIVVWVVTVIVSLLIGYETTVGYYLSLSRTIVFFPFFVGGFYLRNVWLSGAGLDEILSKPKLRWVMGGVAAAMCLLFLYIAFKVGISAQMMYGSYSYAQLGYGPQYRLLLGIVAALFIMSVLFIVPNQRIYAITRLGENTMSVYLLHGFAIKLLGKYMQGMHFSDFEHILLAFGFTIVLLAILGNKFVSSWFKKLF